MKKCILLFLPALLFTFCMPVLANAKPSSDTCNEIDEYLQRSSENANLPGMSVIIVDKDDNLFSNTYGNCDNIDTPFIIGSMSKSFTAVCIMQLVEQNKVDLDEAISTYLPEITEGDEITVRQLLNQTSGLGEYQKISNMKITDSYDTHQYANINYNLLGEIVQSASGMSYDEYVTSNIFNPLEMNHSAASLDKSIDNGLIDGYRNFFGIPVAGAPDYPNENSWGMVACGYISSSASDMGHYLKMYLNGGENIVTQESIETIFYDNVYVDADTPYYYGMGWTLSEQFDEPVLGHTGLVENYMSNMFILPESGIGVVILINTNDYLVTDQMMDSLSGSIVMMLLGEDPIEISVTKYLTSHLLIDSIYLLIFLLALMPLFFLKRYRKRLAHENCRNAVLRLVLFHIVLPMCLLLLTSFLGIPLWVIRYYVPDMFIVLIVSTALLFLAGIIKAVFIINSKGEKNTYHKEVPEN